jgi:hypothetical protein
MSFSPFSPFSFTANPEYTHAGKLLQNAIDQLEVEYERALKVIQQVHSWESLASAAAELTRFTEINFYENIPKIPHGLHVALSNNYKKYMTDLSERWNKLMFEYFPFEYFPYPVREDVLVVEVRQSNGAKVDTILHGPCTREQADKIVASYQNVAHSIVQVFPLLVP